MDAGFSWQKAEENGDICVLACDAIAVIEYPSGMVEIRQQNHYDDNDSVIAIPKIMLPELIERLKITMGGAECN